MLEIRHLYKIYGAREQAVFERLQRGEPRTEHADHVVAIEDVSFQVDPGSTYVIMGLSGSGKSTLVRCINRLHEPTSGAISLGGEDITQASRARLRSLRGQRVAMVFQGYGLLPNRSVLANVAFGLELKRVNEKERTQRALASLELVGLAGWEKRYPAELSGGMQQRVGLARALAMDPEVLLLDEPFSGLDPLTRKQMQRELIELQSRIQKIIVFITHDLDEALTIGNRIGIMREGRLVQEGTPQEVFCKPSEPYVADFVRDVNPLIVLTARDCMRPLGERDAAAPDGLACRVSADTRLADIVGLVASSNGGGVVVEDQFGKAIGAVLPDDILAAVASRGSAK